MKKITKYGLSALCGSLAAVSGANAGDMTVSGGATATWSQNGGQVTGNPIGLASNLTFKGSGELDNGTTFAIGIYHDDKAVWSSADLVITTPSIGSITIDQGAGGTGLDIFDDKMPTAWEEVDGTSLGTGIDKITGVGGSTNIQYQTPTAFGTQLTLAYAGRNDGVQTGDKAVGGDGNSHKEQGYDVLLNINPSLGTDLLSGLNIFAGGSRTEVPNGSASGIEAVNDHEEVVAGATLAIGPVSLGYQRSAEFTGLIATGTTEYYANDNYGISFNISDSLSVSYGNYESQRQINTGGVDVTVEADSYQLAYSVGGASIKIAESDVTNAKYQSGTNNAFEATTIALSLAF